MVRSNDGELTHSQGRTAETMEKCCFVPSLQSHTYLAYLHSTEQPAQRMVPPTVSWAHWNPSTIKTISHRQGHGAIYFYSAEDSLSELL